MSHTVLAFTVAVGSPGHPHRDPPQDQPCGTDSGTGCAPDSERVDLYEPTFGDPTRIDNPLYPISSLSSVVFAGVVDGLPFRTETTLMPETRLIEWNGQWVETVVEQYMAFSDGRLEEIATDWYAQDDLGAVWYFGEDVADYDETGTIFTNEGTWLVGRDKAPLAMIMAAAPLLGDVWRAENIAPIAWEEITVVDVDVLLDGPSGPIPGAIIGSELHMEGTRQEKVFAPGYGEFSTGSLATDDLEALAMAVPIDALDGDPPAPLETMATSTATIFAAAEAGDWTGATDALASFTTAWADPTIGAVPPLVAEEIDRLAGDLEKAVTDQDAAQARQQAIATSRSVYDLLLRYHTPNAIDLVRFDLWCAQVLVDAPAGDVGSVRGDTATLRLVWDRFDEAATAALAAAIEKGLDALDAAADAEDMVAAADVADQLRGAIGADGWQ